MNNITQEITMPTENEKASTKENISESWTAQEKEQSRILYGCEIIQEKCNIEDANNFGLPNDAYIVSYLQNNKECYDITRANKKSNIFDMYWDKFRENFKSIGYAQGRVNPKIWGFKVLEKKKRK